MTDRLADAIRSIIRAEFPNLTYAAMWEYAVTSVNDDGTVNGQPTSDIPLPAMNNIPFESLASGGTSIPKVGNAFLVEFLNVNGAQYGIISCASLVDTAIIDATDMIEIGPSASNPVELGPASKSVTRSGDNAECFMTISLLNGQFTDVSGNTQNLVGFPCFICTTASGLVTSGSDKAFA